MTKNTIILAGAACLTVLLILGTHVFFFMNRAAAGKTTSEPEVLLGATLNSGEQQVDSGSTSAYMSVRGSRQGLIDGDCVLAGREKMNVVYDAQNTVEVPRDARTGLPTGQRVHGPLTVTTHFGVSTPKFYQACTTGEQMQVVLKYYQINESGQEEHYFTIKLENAIIVKMDHNKPSVLDPANKPYGDMISVSFTYSNITWTDVLHGIEASDDWRAPKA